MNCKMVVQTCTALKDLPFEVEKYDPTPRYPVPEMLLFFHVATCEHHDAVCNRYKGEETHFYARRPAQRDTEQYQDG